MKTAMNERAIYIFPGMELHSPTEAEQKAWQDKYNGLLEGFDIDVSQWNWYSFPTTYMLAQLVDHLVGWFLAGLVLARICRQ